MLIWQRHGFVTVIILLCCIYVGAEFDGSRDFLPRRDLTVAFCLLGAAVVNFLFWRLLERNGQGAAQTLFFIPVKYWSIIFTVAALSFFYDHFSR
ncbi:MAG: hypothetical protein AAF677_12590 [Pseudomonadota bacterium]